MIRLKEFQDLLDSALAILGDRAGRVEIVDGKRRVRVGRLLGQAETAEVPAEFSARTAASAPIAPEAVIVRAPGVGVVSFRDTRTNHPLADVGQKISAGQTLAFISSLDITTKVVSPQEGIVEEVFVEDGDGVEYNAPLLKLLPPV